MRQQINLGTRKEQERDKKGTREGQERNKRGIIVKQ